MQINLDSEMLKSVVSEAIMRSLDNQTREALIQGAIQHLLTPREGTSSYGRRTSPLQDAFNSGVYHAAQSIATEMLTKDDAMQTKIRDLLNDALIRLFETKREETISKLADSIRKGLAYEER